MRQVKIKNILFDLGNVLIDLDQDLWKARMKELFDIQSIDELDPTVILKMKEYENGDINTSLFIKHMLSHAPTDRKALDVVNAWNSMLVGIRYGRIELLSELKNKFKLFVLSNTNELHIEWVDKYLMKQLKFPAFYGLFEEIYLSHEIRFSKPSADAYKHVLRNSGLRASETIFFDDRLENIDAASVAGFHGIHVPETKEIKDLILELGFLD